MTNCTVHLGNVTAYHDKGLEIPVLAARGGVRGAGWRGGDGRGGAGLGSQEPPLRSAQWRPVGDANERYSVGHFKREGTEKETGYSFACFKVESA